ncbi:tetratricopeptide repeat protein [Halomonas denitrificans]|uniref:tetratricopeptide repeat protein n=1 Tax=Halomonas TaxID=2745 RepID=UPI001CD6CC7F|nr:MULTISPECIES: tetratricopeptide repeat protein [Halomonas]MCA0975599.1 tetratricopeptide repeat protein [Halomonas denitrificans]MED5294061.1 tetratricopeptide repeat protein [Pseudomonadota bacterium]
MMSHADRLPHCLRIVVMSLAIVLPAASLSGCAVPVTDTEHTPATAYRDLGEAYLRQDNLPRALAALDKAYQLDAADPVTLQALALAHQRQGETHLAAQFFQDALEKDPNFTRARNNYAAFLYDRGQTREACDQLDQASHDIHYAHRAQLFANLGRCRWDLGQIEEARAALQRSQQIDDQLAASHLILADLEYAQGNLMRARSQLDRFVSLAGWNSAARRLAADLGNAEGYRSPAVQGEALQPSRAL